MKLALLISVFVTFQLLALLVFASRLHESVFRRPLLGGVLALMVVEILCAVSTVLGAYGESRWQTLTRLQELYQPQTPPLWEDADPSTSPGLLGILGTQVPFIPRPDFNDRRAVEAWQAMLRAKLADDVFAMDRISVAAPVRFQVESEESLSGGVVRKSLSFLAFDGVEIPAYLFLPPAPLPRPAIVVIPGHVNEPESGISQTAGLVESYQRGAALELARAGFVALTFELRGFGLLGAPYHTEHRLVAYNAILAGTFYKAIVAKDLKTSVDLLQSLPEVDPDSLGVTGVSYGGELSVAYAALDPRIGAIVFQAYGGHVGGFGGAVGTRENQPHFCHIIPAANDLMKQEDILLLLAPRPTLGVRGDKEPFEDKEFAAILQPAWNVYERATSIELRIESGGHEYFIEPALEFFRTNLLNK